MDEKTFVHEMYGHYSKHVQAEWPFFGKIEDRFKYTRVERALPFPLLIRECMRLRPIYNKETGLYEFSVRNMTLRINRWQVTGRIMNYKTKGDYLLLDVCDGTGILQVYMKKNFGEPDQQVDADKRPIVSEGQKKGCDNSKRLDPKDEARKKAELEREKKIVESLKIGLYGSFSGIPILRTAARQKDSTLHSDISVDKIPIGADKSQDKTQNKARTSVQTKADVSTSKTPANAQNESKDDSDLEPNNLWGENKMPRIFLYLNDVEILNEDEYLDNVTTFMEGFFKKKYTTE